MQTAILIPTYNNAFLLSRCLGLMKRLNPQPTFYVILENNSQDETIQVLKRWKELGYPTKLIRLWFVEDAVKRMGSPYAVIGIVRQTLLDCARNLDLDYALYVDDDVFIADADYIQRITAWKKDIVGAPYLRNYPAGTFLATKWLNLGPDRNEFPYTLRKTCSAFEEVYMTSGGSMCLSRRILEDKRLNFYPLLDSDVDTSEDYGFCIQARKLGYRVYLDGSLKLGHYLKASNFKPWAIAKGEQWDPKKPRARYAEFQFGREKELIEEHRKLLTRAPQ